MGALLSTVAACVLIVVNTIIRGTEIDREAVVYPPPSVHGTFEGYTENTYSIPLYILKSMIQDIRNDFCKPIIIPAFASIMFAYAGASTFPTIQADMKDREKFIYSAIIAILSEFLTGNYS